MRHLTMEIAFLETLLGDFVIVRTSQSALNTNLDGITHCTPRLHTVAYGSEIVNVYSIVLHKTTQDKIKHKRK